MNNILVLIFRITCILLIVLLGVFIGMCVPCYLVLKQPEDVKPKISEVINFTTYVIYKVIIKGGKL